ncbi:X-Pro dipeptidyl-peptidase (S15 family) [Thermoleophilum album]|uniref:X-Pro dipeptidyl-peptidase (S15 family) n=2 Tax=Thermoleophilum album TaxID=29539 RepID=A0A1H6FYD3_THEAL|nr:X-Pro dipeptidyl-peptidase (S15 family) [Thermoleophilum album]
MNRPTVSGARMRVIRFFLFCAVLAAWALTAGSAYARVDSVFGGRVACTASGTIRVCNGSSSNLVPTFDGVPLDVTVALPAEPTGGTDGNYPLLIMMHGWGGQKLSVDALRPWAERGYTVLTFTFRGFGESCGARAPRRA